MATCANAVRLVPGPQGAPGADGTDGSDGVSAFTLLTAVFTMPAELGTASASVVSSTWMTPGQVIYLQGAGWLEVQSIPDSVTVVLKNLEDAATSSYLANVAPGTVIALSSKLVASGLQGPAGSAAAAGAPTDGPYLITQANAALTGAVNLGLLTTGLLMQTVAAGVSTPSIAVDGGDYLSPLTGLIPADIGASVQGYDALLAAIAALVTVADRLIYTTGVDTVALTTLTGFARTLLDDADAATARTTLGISSLGLGYILIQHQLATTVGPGAFTAGPPPVIVPLNTIVDDTTTTAVLAANTVTLPAGTYRARWRMTGYQVDEFQSWLLNVTAGTILNYGSNARSMTTDAVTAQSMGEDRFTLAVASNIRIMAEAQTTGTFGYPGSFGGLEVYASLELEVEL